MAIQYAFVSAKLLLSKLDERNQIKESERAKRIEKDELHTRIQRNS